MDIRFYSLFYIDLDETRTLQGAVRKGTDRLNIFIRNAIMLDCSLRASNNNTDIDGLTLLTNNAALVVRLLRENNYEKIKVVEIPFSLAVPKGIRFYSAHFKIDAFKYLSRRPDDEYSILVDNDLVALKPLPRTLYEIAEHRYPLCYHINEENCDRIQADCRRIYPQSAVVEWVGGELWGGVNSSFKLLYDECIKIAPNYFKHVNEGLFHIGDEMLTAIAVAEMEKQGVRFVDAGVLGIIYRYWGMNEKESLEHFDPVLAHLPADKVWIASQSIDRFDRESFLRHYSSHLRLFRKIKIIKKLIRR